MSGSNATVRGPVATPGSQVSIDGSGAPGRNRTCDTRVPNSFYWTRSLGRRITQVHRPERQVVEESSASTQTRYVDAREDAHRAESWCPRQESNLRHTV
jgi:hypothetical protein